MLIFRRALLFYFILLFSISSFAENIKKFDRLIVNGTRLDQTDIENLPLNISIISSEEIKSDSYTHLTLPTKRIV